MGGTRCRSSPATRVETRPREAHTRLVRALRALALAVCLTAVAVPPGGATAQSMTGTRHVLVVLATWEPRPYTRQQVENAVAGANAFLRRSSFGQTRLSVDVTTWLDAYPAPRRCSNWDDDSLDAFVEPARKAAAEAYDLASYERVVYVVPGGCNLSGVSWRRKILLAVRPTPALLVHELGHSYGLAHAGATRCSVCPIEETGDPFSPMGDGFEDFSAYEKRQLGWLGPQPTANKAGRYMLSSAGRQSTLPHALVVDTPAGQYWLEYRTGSFTGLLVRLVDTEAGTARFGPPAVLLLQPATERRIYVGRGEIYRGRGAFSVLLRNASPTRAQLAFAWVGRNRSAMRGVHAMTDGRDAGHIRPV